ncbi:MAG: hypothetical protein ACRDMH_11470 [Solirubrobacterales bacterium]
MRVWTTRLNLTSEENAEHAEEHGSGRPRRRVRRRYPTEALVFDTETEPGPAQRLRLLAWRLYSDAPGDPPGHFCIEEGVAYPDDLPQRDPDGYRILTEDARSRQAEVAPGFGSSETAGGLVLQPLSWWLERRLYLYGYRHRDRCSVVGFNLPFDLARLASYWAPAEDYYRGGFSLGIWGKFDPEGKWDDTRYRQRLLMKSIDPRRTLFGWGSRKKGDEDTKGAAARFIDLRTLAFALTDRSLTLEGACAAFGDPYEKREVDYEEISPELIEYAVEDVRHTSLLYRHTLAELAEHEGVDLPPHRLYSPATVGAHYLEAMGIERPLQKFTNLSDEQLGWDARGRDQKSKRAPKRDALGEEALGYAMSAFYGGRAEARIVRTPVPIVHVDFASMYPAVSELLGTWKILRARELRVVDATDEVRELLNDPELLDRCLTRELWAVIGVTLVEIEPDGDILPVRAIYEPDGQDFGIGVNSLTYRGSLWYALPDVTAAAILGDRPPGVTRAIRIEGEGIQAGLRTAKLRGGAALDPEGERDPFLTMIEQRAQVKADPDMPTSERDRLELFLKITANATAYGSLARFDRRDLAEKAAVRVHGPDEGWRPKRTSNPEDPGPYCLPPVACSITAGARLMLAVLERLVTREGGSYAFCDTDSMAIVSTPEGRPVPCPTREGEEIKALSRKTVREILDRFQGLNPYDPDLLQPWKVEHESLNRQLWCYVISAKRYALYRVGRGGRPEIVAAHDQEDVATDEPAADSDALTDWSEHGLGMYLDPTSKDPDRPQRDKQGRRVWIRQIWERILAGLDRPDPALPEWAERYALSRFTVSSPEIGKWFKGFNRSRDRVDQIRPGSFGLIAHPDAAFYEASNASQRDGREKPRRKPRALPAAPYEQDPEEWSDLAWYDRQRGRPIGVITADQRREPERFANALLGGAVVIDTLANVLGRYTRRPEHKSLAPDRQAAGGATRGLLLRRPVASSPADTLLTGKEGNKIIERLTGVVTDTSKYRSDYGTRADPWTTLIHPTLKDMGAREIIEHGIASSTAYDALSGKVPRGANRSRLEAAAASHSVAKLTDWGLEAPGQPLAILVTYLHERDRRGENVRRCEWCGGPMAPGARADARYCSDACRQRARRARPGA